jgi:hypothetical protein
VILSHIDNVKLEFGYLDTLLLSLGTVRPTLGARHSFGNKRCVAWTSFAWLEKHHSSLALKDENLVREDRVVLLPYCTRAMAVALCGSFIVP